MSWDLKNRRKRDITSLHEERGIKLPVINIKKNN
jgi:hypothetical protein